MHQVPQHVREFADKENLRFIEINRAYPVDYCTQYSFIHICCERIDPYDERFLKVNIQNCNKIIAKMLIVVF